MPDGSFSCTLARFPSAQPSPYDNEYRRSVASLVYPLGIGVQSTRRAAMQDPPSQGRPPVSLGSGLVNTTIMRSTHTAVVPLPGPKHVQAPYYGFCLMDYLA